MIGDAAAAWPVIPGRLWIAGAQVASWNLPVPPATVLCLRRRVPLPVDYPESWRRRGLLMYHLPLRYWEDNHPHQVLRAAVDLIAVAHPPIVAHCALGLDRAGIVALAVLIASGLTPRQARHRYHARGVRHPDDQAMKVLARFVADQEGDRP